MSNQPHKGMPYSFSGSRGVPENEKSMDALIGTDRFPAEAPDWFVRKYGINIWMQWVMLNETGQST